MSAPDDREKGAATVFVLGMAVLLLVCAGLVVDGGLAINARMRVADDAEQAARVAADAIDVDLLRSDGVVSINAHQARQRAADYLQQRGYASGQYAIDVGSGEVTVRVSDTAETMLLGLVGITTFDVNAQATAEPSTGFGP